MFQTANAFAISRIHFGYPAARRMSEKWQQEQRARRESADELVREWVREFEYAHKDLAAMEARNEEDDKNGICRYDALFEVPALLRGESYLTLHGQGYYEEIRQQERVVQLEAEVREEVARREAERKRKEAEEKEMADARERWRVRIQSTPPHMRTARMSCHAAPQPPLKKRKVELKKKK